MPAAALTPAGGAQSVDELDEVDRVDAPERLELRIPGAVHFVQSGPVCPVLRALCFVSTIYVCCLVPAICRAADTIETFDPGVSDFEIYAAYDGAGLPSEDRALGAAALLGIGIVPRFSGYLAVGSAAKEDLSDAEGALALGVFGTPVDTEHFDLDLLLDVTVHGPGFSSFHVLPIAELNLDFPNFGVYLRTGGNLEGTAERDGGVSRNLSIIVNPGVYVTIRERHQLLVEYCGDVHLNDEIRYEQAGIALGYNVALSDRVELINQVSLSIPIDDGGVSAGFMVGMIAGGR